MLITCWGFFLLVNLPSRREIMREESRLGMVWQESLVSVGVVGHDCYLCLAVSTLSGHVTKIVV